MKNQNWTANYFNEFYLKIYSTKLLPPHITKFETDFLVKYLKLKKIDVILDVAAGYCRHHSLLLKKKFNVVALDKNITFLKSALRGKQASSAVKKLINADMRQLPFKDESFDKIFLLFNSFGYFCDEENINVLTEIHRVLKRNGLFLLDLPDKKTVLESIETSPIASYWDENFEVIEEWKYGKKDKILHNKTEFIIKNKSYKTEFYIRLYACSEIKKMLRACDFTIEDVFGEFDGSPYNNTATKMIFLVKK